MKRPNFTLKNFLNTFSEYIKTTTRAFSIVLTFTLIYNSTQAQDCNVILACNDGVQISLDEDCNMYIEPDMVLEGPAYTDDYYDVEAKLPNGTNMPQVTVGMDFLGRPIKRVAINNTHIGMTLKVKVSLRGCANSCWGDATIEDKLAPVISTCPCEPRTTNFTGNVNELDNSYDRPSLLGMACPGVSEIGVRYDTYTFAVDVTGTVDISLPSLSARFSLYNGAFNAASPCTGLIETNVNSFVGNLSVGTLYTIVVSSVTALTPPGGINYTLFLDSRTGNIKSSVAAQVCSLACNGEAALLAQTATNATNRPVFLDACSNVLTYAKNDVVDVLQCSDRYAKIVRRQWTATDPSGNVSDVKTQYFYIRRGTLAEVVCPADWIRDCSVSFTALPNGAPAPSVSGQPTNISCSNIQVYYDDVVFDLCGAGIKVFRQWTIIDWCTGEDKICAQLIKIEDTILPAFTCPVLPNVSAASDKCAATWAAIPPSATDCSFITWEIYFSKEGTNLVAPPVGAFFTKSDGTTTVTGITPLYAAQISSTARPYTITGLPLGKTWIKYVVIDECDNVRECITSITVVDNTPPTAICEDQTVVSIDDSGWAELYAESLDNHSLDNCGPIAKYEIKRKTTTCAGYASDLNFGNKVRFCCTDITSPVSYVSVVLRVYDAAGNFNECETTVKVQNKRPPTITCPTNKTLQCGDLRIAAWVAGNVAFDTTFFGKPTVGGVCNDLIFASRIVSNNITAKCGTGSVVREWYLVSNPTVNCRQTLTVTSPPFSPANVTFPGTVVLATCDLTKATPEVLNSKPVVDNVTCRDIGISHTDQLFYNVPEACVKILRTWRVIDWCSYPNAQVIAENTQTIKLTGSGGAQFTGCTNKTFDSDPGKCDKEVTLTATATDDCTDAEDLKYIWSLDLGKNNSVDASGTGNSFTRVLPAGTHKVTFTVVNRCGTSTSCTYDVTIRSTKKPTPVCLREVVWVLDSDGSTQIWASDFNLKSENNCGDDSKLKYSFNSAGNQLSRTFTCADIPNGQVARIPLKMYVIDENGNFDFCDVILILQDSPLTNACTDNAGLLPAVAGKISTELNEGLDNVEVALTNMTSAVELKDMTKNQGEYKFTGVDVFDPKTISAFSNGDILNGVSTLDLVMIQRHILGIQKFESPYKLLAADINNSRGITASDLVNLRKLILGITVDFENNTSWRFIPTEYVFQDPAFPFDFPSKINVDSIFEDKSNVNFTAVKVGDVNNSALANINSTSSERRSSHALFVTEEKSFAANSVVKYEIKAGDAMDIIGAQFALEFDADQLTFTGVQSGDIALSPVNFNDRDAQNGKLAFSIDIPKGMALNADDVLFTIEFKAAATGNTSNVKLDAAGINAEVYESDATVRPLHLQLRNKTGRNNSNVLYQNEPNPFKDVTNISFELAKQSNVVIRVLDVNGKTVFRQVGKFEKGYNTVTLANNQLTGSGVYYYQIEAGEFSATKKMILIE